MTTKVYSAILAVMTDIAKNGIGKDRTNKTQGFKFRGIDDVYAALSPLLSKHGLLILPRVISHAKTSFQSKGGGNLFSVVVHAEFDLVSTEDGSKHTVSAYGEGMDSGDKATSKALSIAFKYAAFETFCIPVEGALPDPDAESHEVEGNIDAINRLDGLLKEFDVPEEKITGAYGVDKLEDLDPKTYNEVETRIRNYASARADRKSGSRK